MKKRWNLVDARESRGMNQRALSKVIKKSYSTTCEIENGLREPNQDIQITLEKYFSMPKEKLFKLFVRETPKPTMKNSYEIRGEVTAIHLRNKLGKVTNEAIIDTDDLDRLMQLPVTWSCQSRRGGSSNYVRGRLEGSVIHLHRLINGTKEDFLTDHINHNGLDNRKSNLREATVAENNQNKKGANKNSKSGIRGVTPNYRYGEKWIATIRVNNIIEEIGRYNTPEEAESAVKEARKNKMPFSKEALAN